VAGFGSGQAPITPKTGSGNGETSQEKHGKTRWKNVPRQGAPDLEIPERMFQKSPMMGLTHEESTNPHGTFRPMTEFSRQ
jgi:hypothetical protein